jgi:glycosyltransferase involved in cell wall biosynthesis
MKIGFDAKRAFHNTTGLGNYSRTLLNGLARMYPEHEYFLFNPKASKQFPQPDFAHVHEVRPTGLNKLFSSLWRSRLVTDDIRKLKLDLYHGLSHEIPVGINKTSTPSVVTIHDLIFERYPEQFSRVDVQIYRRKFRYACEHADRIIAISKQTKSDIIERYGIEENKIDICYQSCDPAFEKKQSADQLKAIQEKYQLPSKFFLSVGSIIERKNLLNVCKALLLTKNDLPLVVIGNGGEYKKRVQQFVSENGLSNRVIFLTDRAVVRNDNSFQQPSTFAAIYQLAEAMIYPSFFEGFGIPVLEAMWSGLPVITSNVSCLPETAGEAGFYVNPGSAEEIALAMDLVISDQGLRTLQVEKGKLHASRFTVEACTRSVMEAYNKIVR